MSKFNPNPFQYQGFNSSGLSQGISQAGNSFGDAIKAIAEKKKQEEQQGLLDEFLENADQYRDEKTNMFDLIKARQGMPEGMTPQSQILALELLNTGNSSEIQNQSILAGQAEAEEEASKRRVAAATEMLAYSDGSAAAYDTLKTDDEKRLAHAGAIPKYAAYQKNRGEMEKTQAEVAKLNRESQPVDNLYDNMTDALQAAQAAAEKAGIPMKGVSVQQNHRGKYVVQMSAGEGDEGRKPVMIEQKYAALKDAIKNNDPTAVTLYNELFGEREKNNLGDASGPYPVQTVQQVREALGAKGVDLDNPPDPVAEEQAQSIEELRAKVFKDFEHLGWTVTN